MNAKAAAAEGPIVRRAHDDELRACRMLLPTAFFPLRVSDLYVAVGPGAEGELLGAAAMAWIPGGFPIQIHVLPAHRRRGIGNRLLAALTAAARGETPRLRSWGLLPEDGAGAAFLAASGFAMQRRFLSFETDAEACMAIGVAFRRRLEQRGRIPAEARVVAIDEAPPWAVASLVASELGTVATHIAARLASEGPAAFTRYTSVALMVGDELAGVLLSRREADAAAMEINVVAPAYRRSWANAVLLAEAIRRCAQSGARRLRFLCDEQTRDTVNLASRAGVRPASAGLILERPVRG